MYQPLGISFDSPTTMQGAGETMEWNEEGQLICDNLDWKTAPLDKIFYDGQVSKETINPTPQFHTIPQKKPAHGMTAVSAIVTSKLHSVNYNAPPKRPQSAYEIFVKVERKRILNRLIESGYAGNVDIPYELAKSWKAMKEWEKDVYRNLARMERRLYNQELVGWKERRRHSPVPVASRLNLPLVHNQKPGLDSRRHSPCTTQSPASPQQCHQPAFRPLNRIYSEDTASTGKPTLIYNNYNDPTVFEL